MAYQRGSLKVQKRVLTMGCQKGSRMEDQMVTKRVNLKGRTKDALMEHGMGWLMEPLMELEMDNQTELLKEVMTAD